MNRKYVIHIKVNNLKIRDKNHLEAQIKFPSIIFDSHRKYNRKIEKDYFRKKERLYE